MKKSFPSSFLVITFLSSFSFTVFAADNNAKPLVIDSNSLIVQTLQGKIRGTTEKKVCTWKGIAYAKAPVGDLRFRGPQPAEKWSGIKDTKVFGPMAPQTESSFAGKNEIKSEDCLSLNIWSPAADGKQRPVMFWIHGGGFTIGSGSSELYNGANLANNGDVVVVTINYRLGVLGFLYFDSETSKQAGFENNLGIQDQIAALQWVKENIAAFGGNPNQVTIFGESAGGTSVETLLACPTVKGLFKGAIAESGPAAILWQPATAKELTNKYLSFLGVSPNNLQVLKTLHVDTLKKAEDKLLEYMVKETSTRVFSPTIDGQLIVSDIFTCLSPKQTGNVALLIGTNKDESSIFASRKLKMVPRTAKTLDKEFLYVLSEQDKKKVTSAYSRYPHTRGILDLVTDAIFRVPAIRMAECQSMHTPVYMYRFEWSPFLLNLAGLRSFHGLEIPFVFGNSDGKIGKILRLIATKKLVRDLSGKMQQSWVNFARYGNPNGNTDGEWKQFDTNERQTMIFNRKSKLVKDPDYKQREAWDGVKYY
jgi:para-nitrobenzyl esterase